MRKLTTILILSFFAVSAEAQYVPPKKEDESGLRLKGPSIHLSAGVRMRKSPDADTVHAFGGGLKFSLFSVMFSGPTYLSFVAPGVHYFGGQEMRIAYIVSPLIFNHSSGFGISVDWYSTRHDRPGGNIGASLNLDVFQLASFVGGFMK